MPAFLLPDPHVGSAANFSFPCYPLDREDGTWIMAESNDDMSFELILPFDFKLYGTVYPAGTSIFLNNNGNLSFDNAISSFTASEFPINSPMIAPFWSDVDTRAGGEVWYKFFPDNKLAVIWDQVSNYVTNLVACISCDFIPNVRLLCGIGWLLPREYQPFEYFPGRYL